MMDRKNKDLQVRKIEGTAIETIILASINLLKRDLREGLEVIWELRVTTPTVVIKLHIIDLVTVDLQVNVREAGVLVEVKDSRVT
jgi:hypothetical protein